ncbi:alcohol dehydrogenase [Enterococcus florum]|uniref:Alcohol dehydrogenase n=1 Tax=Enterococcus florum TaxID=2480627 RepID=A0A4V0WPN2_9ENTE|nr:YhdH/YhfP family quinone oxidoreductase [Enterococcus florum]GCF94449.1 alcohol dehydrogenase [Enterococcus florum]
MKSLQVSNDPQVETKMVEAAKPILGENEVLVQVDYSGINYKDALATQPNTGVLRSYPLTPGIDLSGVVIESNDSDFPIGTPVLATGYGLGVSRNGGFSEFQAVPTSWLIKRPATLSAKQAMIFGTAGFTAALAVDALEAHGLDAGSRVLVTGATGGVGSVALQFLKQIGCKEIIALTRKTNQSDYLKALGATQILSPEELFPEKNRPLNKQLFDFVVDTVGGETLAKLLPFVQYGGSLALCGNAGGIKLNTTVLPFILRGVNLLGIDSVDASMEKRLTLWNKMATKWQVSDSIQVQEVTLEEVLSVVNKLLEGTHVGRTIVRIGGQ